MLKTIRVTVTAANKTRAECRISPYRFPANKLTTQIFCTSTTKLLKNTIKLRKNINTIIQQCIYIKKQKLGTVDFFLRVVCFVTLFEKQFGLLYSLEKKSSADATRTNLNFD